MKYLSLKILILCILLPPVLYIITVQFIEGYLTDKYTDEIENIYAGDTQALFAGSVRLQDEISNNIKGIGYK